MLIAMTLSALFTIVAVATMLSLIDSYIRGHSAYTGLRREKALLDRGFVEQVAPRDPRLRRPRPRTLAGATRPRSRRTPALATQLSA